MKLQGMDCGNYIHKETLFSKVPAGKARLLTATFNPVK